MIGKKDSVFELTSKDQLVAAFPIMKQLRTDLEEMEFLDLFEEMHQDGYRLFAMEIENEIVSLIGFSWRINFYNKRHIFIYDLVTDETKRSFGYGEKLLVYIHHWAKNNGAEFVALESGLNRKDAHRFYENKLEYDKWCYSFRKKL